MKTPLYDRWILISTTALVCIGLIMVASASMVISDRQYGYPFHYLIRQSIYILMAIGVAWATARVPLKTWYKLSRPLLLIILVLLALVLIPGIGRAVNGSRRWLSLGIITVQVSELAKLFLIVFLSAYLQRYQHTMHEKFSNILKPLLLLCIVAVLLLLEPDFGSLAVISIAFLGLLFLSGMRLWPFIIILALVAAALATLAVVSPYRLERLTTFLNPWLHPFDSGYQLTQSLIAFGRGGYIGVGLGNSIQKLFYLPEAHTDFLFAVLAEELGLLGETIVIALFCLLVGRAFIIASACRRAQQWFASYLGYGLGLWISLQAGINIGVNAGILPTKGLTLPFISYGGSSMLVNAIVVGILFRVVYEHKTGDATINDSHPDAVGRTHYSRRRAKI